MSGGFGSVLWYNLFIFVLFCSIGTFETVVDYQDLDFLAFFVG